MNITNYRTKIFLSNGSACVELQLQKLDNESVGPKSDQVS
jgi:hypothetical protein